MEKYFAKPIKSIRLEGPVWIDNWDIILTMLDGSQEVIPNHLGCLQLEKEDNPFKKYSSPPPRVREIDFELVWESEPRPYGMDRCAVGDLDNDGIIELVTWYKDSHYADTAYMLIYKSVGDDEYELFMEEPFYTEASNDALTHLLITDIDQNGQKELVYTLEFAYFWEFSEPGVYVYRRSNNMFARAVMDGTISDVDQDSILELSFLTANSGLQPPTQYVVWEYSWKSDYYFGFTGITGFYQDWIDCRIDVGDFDNDGVVNIVSGNAGWVGTLPVDIQYFCYDSTVSGNFTQHWLETGVANSCATPVIADLDNDGDNELFAGGIYSGGGSSFIWESTGSGIGYVSWIDTTDRGPNESNFGFVDYLPSVISIYIIPWLPDDSQLQLWSFPDFGEVITWQSSIVESTAYNNPHIADMDFDGKKNIIVTGNWWRKAHDWEQLSAGIGHSDPDNVVYGLQLYPNYPNPFNGVTSIPFSISKKSEVVLKIFDITGREVHTHNYKIIDSGEYCYFWNASGLSTGLYIISLKAGNLRKYKKAILLK